MQRPTLIFECDELSVWLDDDRVVPRLLSCTADGLASTMAAFTGRGTCTCEPGDDALRAMLDAGAAVVVDTRAREVEFSLMMPPVGAGVLRSHLTRALEEAHRCHHPSETRLRRLLKELEQAS